MSGAMAPAGSCGASPCGRAPRSARAEEQFMFPFLWTVHVQNFRDFMDMSIIMDTGWTYYGQPEMNFTAGAGVSALVPRAVPRVDCDVVDLRWRGGTGFDVSACPEFRWSGRETDIFIWEIMDVSLISEKFWT